MQLGLGRAIKAPWQGTGPKVGSSSDVTEPTENRVEWRNMIFIPFHPLWKLLIHLTITAGASMAIYDNTFDENPDVEKSIDYVFYVFEGMFCVDTVLCIMHRNMVRYRVQREHQPRNMFLQALDVATLIPVYEMCAFLTSITRYQQKWHGVRHVMRCKLLFRLYRVFLYFRELSYRVGYNQAYVVTASAIFHIYIITYILAAIWYSLACYNCPRPNWTHDMDYFMFDPEKSYEWLIICYCTMGGYMQNNWRGFFHGITPLERLITILTMIFGYIMHMMYYQGKLSEAIQKYAYRQYNFERRLAFIIKIMDEWKIPKAVKERTLLYYNTLWDRRQGLSTRPKLFSLLPTPFQKEITLDIYWECLRHCRLFRDHSIAFKRALSLEMKSEMYLQGDFIYRLHELKSKMFYIVTGVIQILTAEDEDSPIISFSNGSILGEISVLIPTKCQAYVRCATYCEVHTLTIGSLFKVLLSFPEESKLIHRFMLEKIEQAQSLLEYRQKKYQHLNVKRIETTVRWLKKRWRQLIRVQNRKSIREEAMLSKYVEHDHTSQNLDILVLSDDFELKTRAICMRSRCPFVLEPSSSFRRFCDRIVLIVIALQCYILPYIVFVMCTNTGLLGSLMMFSNIIFFIDLYLQGSTAITDKSVLIAKLGEILAYRVKTVPFLLDIIATIPFDMMGSAAGADEQLILFLMCNRLLKVYRLLFYIREKERALLVNFVIVRLMKYVLIGTLAVFWTGCVMYNIACYRGVCDKTGWLMYNAILRKQNIEEYGTLSYRVMRVLFYMVSMFCHMNTSYNFEYKPFELLVGYFVAFIGCFFFIFYTGELTALFYVRFLERRKYKTYIQAMVQHMKTNQIKLSLQKQVCELLQFQWFYNESVSILGQEGILTNAPMHLKESIVLDRIIACLQGVPLFKNCTYWFLHGIARNASHRFLPPGALLMAADDKSSWMHCIVRGYCRQESVMAGDRERGSCTILKPGASFPVVEVLHQVLVLVNVRSITAVELISVHYAQLVEAFQTDIPFNEALQKTLKEHMTQFDKSLLRKQGRLPKMIPPEKSKGQGERFTYELMDVEVVDYEALKFHKPFEELKKFYMLRYLLMRRTIDPMGKFFFGWEVSRYISAFIMSMVTITFYNALVKVQFVTIPIMYGCTFLSLADFYIRAHCRYYNEDAILVTHPWATTKHYLKTSFLVDLWAIFPVFLFDRMFGTIDRQTTYTVLMMITRPFAMHRFISYLTYRQSNIECNRDTLIQTIKYFIITFEFLCVTATIMQISTCLITIEDNVVRVLCRNSSWLTRTHFATALEPYQIFVECLYYAVTLFTCTSTGTIRLVRGSEMTFVMIVFIVLFLAKTYMFTKLVSYRVGGDVNLTIFQERVNSFENFIQEEMVDEDLIEATVEHFRYKWKRDHGNDISTSLARFHPQLHEDLTYSMFGSTLRAVDFFEGADDSFFRLLGGQLREIYFKKDAEIIRCNQVQRLIYFVHKGRVDVTVAKTRVGTMGMGGIFGCLSKLGIMRQTIAVSAKVHVNLLAIDAMVFNKIIVNYPNIYKQVHNLNLIHVEFVESKRFIVIDDTHSFDAQKDQVSRSTVTSSARTRVTECLRYFRFVLDNHAKYYKIYNYITSVHIAPITSILYLLYIFLLTRISYEVNQSIGDTLQLYVHITTAFLDLYFYARIYIGFHMAYKDPESGIRITDFRMIARRYMRTPRKFWLDVFSCIPFEYIVIFVTKNEFYMKLGWFNRVTRMDYLLQYYNEKGQQLDIRTHLRITYLFYLMAISMQLMTCLWSCASCLVGSCIFVVKTGNHVKGVRETRSTAEDLLSMYGYVVAVFTTTGARDVIPVTFSQVFVSIIIAMVFMGTLIVVVSGFIALCTISKYSMRNYEMEIESIKLYLQGRKLSLFLFNKMWQYFMQLWQRQRGEWMPVMVTEAPAFLRQDLMYSLYGGHIESHPLFSRTHMDFMRQLVTLVTRCVFFPGNFLAVKGDIDHSMYFIHDGMVDVIDRFGNMDNVRQRLGRNACFGEAQGLLKTPHMYSYVAHTIVDVAILKFDDWEYLLHWFPASRMQLWQAAMEMGLKVKKDHMEHQNPRYY